MMESYRPAIRDCVKTQFSFPLLEKVPLIVRLCSFIWYDTLFAKYIVVIVISRGERRF